MTKSTIGVFPGTQSANAIVDVVNPAVSLYSTTAGTQTITLNVNPTASGSSVNAKLYCYTADGAVNPTPVATTTMGLTGANSQLPITLDVPNIGFYELDLSVTDGSGNVEGAKITTFTVMPVNTPDTTTQFGVGTHIANSPAGASAVTNEVNLIAKAGFSHVRDNFYWTSVESTAGVYSYPYDTFVTQANLAGLSVLGILGYGNGVENVSSFPTTVPQITAFSNYARALATHYLGTVNNWEVWNEAQAFGGGTVPQYAALAQSAYTAIRTANPTANVALCAGTVAQGQGDGGAMHTCLDAVKPTIAGNFTWSIHPYMAPANPDQGFVSTGSPLGDYFNVQSVGTYDTGVGTQSGIASTWWSEIGWYTITTSAAADARSDELTQAAYIPRTYLNVRKFPYIGAVFIYDFRDDGISATSTEDNFGLIRNDSSPKPSYLSMAVLANTIGNKAYTGALLDTTNARVYQYGSGTAAVYAGWTNYPTAFTTTQTVSISLPAGTYIERSWNGDQTTIAFAGGSMNWTVGPLPKYLIRQS